ncbi:hypothetical protein BG006_005991 [Podila minutissima]|uniref:AIG1-type G domain-containing protein n=1 Tax=Podila minutissima TaxID=64525 RepID=A0A9P5VLY7_9FUNG|nr:hypothetical protein BG006_005991 [Podila minutissima]
MEALKLYADPKYNINRSRIGSGNVSLTTEVRQESICTHLPEFQVFKKGDHTKQRPVAYDAFIKEDKGTYEDKLNARREYQRPEPGKTWSSVKLEFNIIDTPGLNDTMNQDKDHVSKIFSALGGKSLHLVLVTVSRGAFTQGLQQALRSYMDLFPQLRDIVAFVHTRVDYLELHPDMTNFQSYMKENVGTLSKLMGRLSFPHFWIDCDFETTKPIRKCITNNTLHNILRLAVENEPVDVLHSQTLNKTPKMKEIDRIIKNEVKAVIQSIESTLEFKDKEEEEVALLCEDMSPDWHGTFKKETQDYNYYYHVKLYAKKCSRFKAKIDVLTRDIADLKNQLQHRVNESALQPKEALSKIQSIVDDHNQHMEVIRLASTDTLPSDLFVKLVEARAFAGPTDKSSERVVAVYREFAKKVSKPRQAASVSFSPSEIRVTST